MDAFWTAFGLIFVTEIIDKSRLAGLLLVTTYRAPWKIFWGMTLAYAILEGMAVALGGMIPAWVPADWIDRGTGILFIAIGAATLAWGQKSEDEARRWLGKVERWGLFWVSFVAIAVTEMADRTQIAVAALSAETRAPWMVYAGAMASLVALNALTVWIGGRVAVWVKGRPLHVVAGVSFIVFGIFLL